MPVAAPITFAGQIHVFQVHGTNLWHKWLNGGGALGNESVFQAAGIGYVDVPDQLPGVAVVDNQLVVVVEDSNGRAWYFGQNPGGPWGYYELP